MKRLWLTAFTICAAITARPALAQSASSDPTAQRHLGFFLQMDVGPGWLSTSTPGSGFDVKLHGPAFDYSIAVGGAVSENFIIAGHLWGASAASPDFEVNGQEISTGTSTLDFSGIGVDFTYYFMPMNIYLSASPLITTLSLQEGGLSGSTKTGFAIRLAAGKEWWVSDHWGIGVNGQTTIGSNKDNDTSSITWRNFFGGIAFSATYN